MIRRLAILALTASICGTVVAQEQTDADKAFFKSNRILQVALTESQYGADGKVLLTFKFTRQYDQHGNLLIEMAYGSDGLPEAELSSVYKYDSHNNPIEATRGSGKQTVSYVYNQAGKVVESRVMDDKGALKARHVLSWNANGTCDEVQSYSADGTAGARRTYKYDRLGNLIESAEYDANRSLVSRQVHTYSATKPYVDETKTFGPDGLLAGRITYERNSLDALVQQKEYTGAGKLTRRDVYKVDNRGLAVEHSEYEGDGKLMSVTAITYQFFP